MCGACVIAGVTEKSVVRCAGSTIGCIEGVATGTGHKTYSTDSLIGYCWWVTYVGTGVIIE